MPAGTAAVAAGSGMDGGEEVAAGGVARTTTTVPCMPAPLEHRAGLVLVVGLGAATVPDDNLVTEALDVGVGGVLVLPPNVQTADQLREFTTGIKERAGRPLLVVTGDESGRVSSFRKAVGRTPSARELAATRSPADVREFAQGLGAKLADLGATVVLAPVLDLDDGPSGAIIGDRSFSADPRRAAEYGLAWARGLSAAGVAPTAKHFPGHGRSREDSHSVLATIEAPLADLQRTDLVPFQEVIDAGIPVVMTEHVVYSAIDPELPASLSPAAYRLLRDMGFEGVAVTDSLAMGSIGPTWPPTESAVMAVAAGADAVLITMGHHARAMRDSLVAAVHDGRLPESRLDEAASRVLALAGADPHPVTCRAVRLPSMSR